MARRAGAGRTEDGAAAVEFALIAPLLLLLAFGIITYGYMLSFRQAISQAAAEGARAAAISLVPTAATATGVSAVNDALGSYGVTCSVPTGATSGSLLRGGAPVGSCAVTPAPCVNNSSVSCTSVRITYDYRNHPLVPQLPGLGLLTPDALAYTAVVRTS